MTDITLLDGSIGQEIVKRTGDAPTPLWSTSVMMDKPEVLRDVHADYFNAGATIATTNTYAVHIDRLEPVDLQDQQSALLQTAMSEARVARDAHGSGRIAVALGPLGASYRPDIKTPLEEGAAAFQSIVSQLEHDADLVLIETASSLHHAQTALMGCAHTNKPVWLALSVDDTDGTKLRSGEPLSDIAKPSRQPPCFSTAHALKPSARDCHYSLLSASPSEPTPTASHTSQKASCKTHQQSTH